MAQTAHAFRCDDPRSLSRVVPVARFRRTKSAVKLRTLLELRGNIPTFVEITDGKAADVTQLDASVIEPGALYVFDRGYTEVGRLCPAPRPADRQDR